jgi:hypothetical protein
MPLSLPCASTQHRERRFGPDPWPRGKSRNYAQQDQYREPTESVDRTPGLFFECQILFRNRRPNSNSGQHLGRQGKKLHQNLSTRLRRIRYLS